MVISGSLGLKPPRRYSAVSYTHLDVYKRQAEALRQGTFQVVSILTSTGFQTIPSFADLGPALLFLFGLLMLVGAEARSTSGGIKLYRVAVASLGLGHDLHERYGNKRHVTSIKINRFGKRSVLTEVDVAEAQTLSLIHI